ncbi:MAG TPA: LOG family protein [Ktedonobacterales bacterium]|jgi:hypothetical protein
MAEARAESYIITVFGSSRCPEDSTIYRDAHELGKQLAEADFTVCNGGYDGAMQAVSRGAREAGGHVIGIMVDQLFRASIPNPWLVERIQAETIFARLEALTNRADGFVVVTGGTGTLTELFLVWSLSLLDGPGPRPIILLGENWRPVLESLVANLDVHPKDLAAVQIAATPANAIALLQQRLEHKRIEP